MKKWIVALALFVSPAHAERVLVKFAPGASPPGILASVPGVEVIKRFDHLGWEVWNSGERDGFSLCQDLKQNPGVLIAYPDPILRPALLPPDTGFYRQWYHENTGPPYGYTPDADIDTPQAWDLFTGDSTFRVGVCDNGIALYPQRFELRRNTFRNMVEVNGVLGFDDDANGFVDDTLGWDFGGVPDPEPRAYSSHGTAVAGVIGAEANHPTFPTYGIAGINWRVSMLITKYTEGSEQWGYESSVAAALDYMRMMGCKVLNLSLGTMSYTYLLEDAIAACTAAGMLTVCAAGNGTMNLDCCPQFCSYYPAGLPDPGIISVGASDKLDQLAEFSNFGFLSVDLFAPGKDIWSVDMFTLHSTFNGTSFATPMVTGAAALLWASNPILTAGQVKQRILTSVDILPPFTGKCTSGGRLNVGKCLMAPGGGGDGEIESAVTPSPTPTPAEKPKLYDVQGRRIDNAAPRSGVTFSKGKRVIVKKADDSRARP